MTDELREILLDLWKAQGSPISGYILAGRNGQPVILDNLSKRAIAPALNRCSICQETESPSTKAMSSSGTRACRSGTVRVQRDELLESVT